MVEERGRVVAIEPTAIWVETIQSGGCQSCSARAGCGSSLLGRYFASASRIRVALSSQDPKEISLNDTAVIGIRENALASSALLVYLLPLVCLVLAALSGDLAAGEMGAIAGALAGLLVGAVLVRLYSRRRSGDPAYTPVLLRVEPSRPL